MRKEIKAECEWLEKWGSTFKEAFIDSTLGKGKQMQKMYQTCLDAYFALRGEKMRFHTDESLLADLTVLKTIIDDLAKSGFFASPGIYKKHIEMLDSIIKMLSLTRSNTEGVQTELF